MAKPKDLGKERFWRQTIQLQQQSGLSVRAFCRQEQISEFSFYSWKRTIAKRDQQLPPFVPLTLLKPSPSDNISGSSSDPGLELRFANGRLLRITASFDEATLLRLLPLLEESQP